MNKGLRQTVLLLLAAIPATPALADSGYGSSYYLSVPVVQVDPITTLRKVNHPVRQCREPEPRIRHDRYHDGYDRRHQQQSYIVPSIFGGLIGGLIGNQFGGGNGRKALTIAGALAGSSIARDAARSRNHHYDTDDYQPARICTTSYRSEVVEDVSGYDVTYEYGGQYFSKRMSEHPGDSMRIRVELAPEV